MKIGSRPPYVSTKFCFAQFSILSFPLFISVACRDEMRDMFVRELIFNGSIGNVYVTLRYFIIVRLFYYQWWAIFCLFLKRRFDRILIEIENQVNDSFLFKKNGSNKNFSNEKFAWQLFNILTILPNCNLSINKNRGREVAGVISIVYI